MRARESQRWKEIEETLLRFSGWLEQYGELSHDHQSFFASHYGRWAKSLYYKRRWLGIAVVAPMIACEALLPSARLLFWKAQRFPIADAHYAMGYALLAQTFGEEKYYQRAVHFLEVLNQTRCQGHEHFCWGYPFDWETRNGTFKHNTPLITTVPYVYEAFSQVYEIDKRQEWRTVMQSIARHMSEDYFDVETSPLGSSVSYYPSDHSDLGRVVNASAYRAFALTKAALDFSEDKYRRQAERNLHFVLESQNVDGSWFYAMDGQRSFVDHFHTCFVMKALAKIERLTGNQDCTKAIERAITYYIQALFDKDGLPKPFSKAPRLTVYCRELYDYAECLNLATLLRGRSKKLDQCADTVLSDVLLRWQKPDGAFRARQLQFGWDNVPMHRWAQSQMFRSLCFLLHENGRNSADLLQTTPLYSKD